MNSETLYDTLEAMGLTLYVARYPLPGAAASPALPQAPSLKASSTEARGPSVDGGVAGPPPSPAAESALSSPDTVHADAGEALKRPRPAAAVVSAPTPAISESMSIAPFTVAAVALGSCLWLEELADGVLAQDQVRLIRAICRAFGWPTEPVTVNQFAWPMHRNPQLDQSGEAALAALSAFVHRQMESSQSRRMILLGQPVQDRLEKQVLEMPVMLTRSTRDMLSEPLLKREVWRDLRALR